MCVCFAHTVTWIYFHLCFTLFELHIPRILIYISKLHDNLLPIPDTIPSIFSSSPLASKKGSSNCKPSNYWNWPSVPNKELDSLDRNRAIHSRAKGWFAFLGQKLKTLILREQQMKSHCLSVRLSHSSSLIVVCRCGRMSLVSLSSKQNE